MALGAFLAGMVVGQSEFSARAGAEALPMRDAFAVMFFLSVGMLFNPGQALKSPLLVLATLGVVMIGKPIAAYAIAVLLGYGAKVGIGVAVALAQVGEFSFLLAVLGRDLGALPADAMNPLVATAIISIMLNPFLYRHLATPEGVLQRWPRMRKLLETRPETAASPGSPDYQHRAVVVGYGHIGQSVARLLRERGIEPTIVEMNIETFRRLRDSGIQAVFGDANQRAVLEAAGVEQAASLILSASGSSDAVEAIRIARSLNPDIHVVVRADYVSQSAVMRKAGANEVFAGEGEVALAMTSSILSRLGATPEQLDQERERIRMDLVRGSEEQRPAIAPGA
jgi:CPA2 family monovalent cation:H+ antiporter-2